MENLIKMSSNGEVNGYKYIFLSGSLVEVITPFTDEDNDSIVIYLEIFDDEVKVTDDGWTTYKYTNHDLAFWDNEADHISSLNSIVETLDIVEFEGELYIITRVEEFEKGIQRLIKAIISINNLRKSIKNHQV